MKIPPIQTLNGVSVENKSCWRSRLFEIKYLVEYHMLFKIQGPIHIAESRGRHFLGAAYFGPETG